LIKNGRFIGDNCVEEESSVPRVGLFGLRADGEGKMINDDVAVCCQCNNNVRASGGNTSNLLSHLRIHHLSKYIQVLQAQKDKARESSTASSSSTSQATLPELFTKAQKYERTTKRWREIADSVTYCIRKDMLPIYTAGKEGFRRLVDTLDLRYEIPSAKYFSNVAIPALYEKTRERVAAENYKCPLLFFHYRYVVQLNNGTIFELFCTLHR